MPVDDLWYLRKRGPNNERIRSKRYGRGRRWRVRYSDAQGNPHERLFERKVEADEWDFRARSGTATEATLDLSDRQVTFAEYGERWRLSREIGWAAETRRRVASNLRLHLYPVFGSRSVRAITLTSVLEWIAGRLADDTPKSTLRLYFELLDSVMGAAAADKVIPDNPCGGVKLSQILRGLSRAPKWVPTEVDVLALFDVVPQRYHAALWLGAGQGCRVSETLGMEAGHRCFDPAHGELHVVQQLRYSPRDHGGFYLSGPKAGSSGTVDLDPTVDKSIADHIRDYPPVEVEMVDITSGDPVRRMVPLLFTTRFGNPFTDRTWSHEWAQWRDRAGWPKEHGGFHALRHFFATTLITNNAEPKDVQRALRHKSLQITLETYVHWWPRRERRRGVIGDVLRAADSRGRWA
jgi:integrase